MRDYFSDVKEYLNSHYKLTVKNEKSESVDMDATREIKLKGEGVKSKAKELLGDIFPFKED